MRILLLDTFPDRNRRCLSHSLSRLPDVAVTVATSGVDAIAEIRRTHFALAICGFDAQSCDKSDDINQAMPLIRAQCTTVLRLVPTRDAAVIESTFSTGFDDYLLEDHSERELELKVCRARQFDQLNQRLAQAQKLESIGELASGIAHEINTPIQYVGDNTRFVQKACDDLTSVVKCCQQLVKPGDTEEARSAGTELQALMDDVDVDYLLDEIPSAIEQTLEGVERVTNIVRAMKEFAHPGLTEFVLADLTKSIENTAMVARNEWKYVADLETVFDPEMPPVPCLPGELNQVLLNMIVNAAHAISETLDESSQEKGKITITTRLATPDAEIRIADTGAGIHQEDVERIFTPFFTTKPAGKGTGQGLAIARTVVEEKHGGTIHVESTVGECTTFVIRLPLESASDHRSRTEDALASV